MLSDDLYRYLVDGQAILRGISPYAMAPEAADFLPPDMANLPELVNHSHLITLYPPAAQIVFAAGATMGILIDPLIGMKLVLCIMDICTCMMMITLVRSLDIPACRVILYAWNPLPVMEIAGSGHIDGAAVFFFTAALMLTSRAKTGIFTGVFMALAILTKWIPLMILPAWLLLVPNKKRATALASALLTSGILTALFWPELTNGIATLGQYLRHWEFSGFVFRSLRQLSGSGIIARSIVAALFTGIVGVLFIRHVFFHTSRKNIFAYLAVVSTAFPMLSPTVYPWYALYPAACLSFVQTPAVLILSWSVLLSYRILMVRHTTGLWIEDDLTPLLIIAAPAAAIAIQGIVARFSMRQ
ncbi:Protein of unknown function [Desulfobacula phenolica]|uniref:DUF2029 domain-containing protein n=1 Tax=Desulfobacula phenolica TaxID=90732 RepID=A0A1H2DXV7_9BACT|nr:Protein of unknown function [Desulfobacula phenolica]